MKVEALGFYLLLCPFIYTEQICTSDWWRDETELVLQNGHVLEAIPLKYLSSLHH